MLASKNAAFKPRKLWTSTWLALAFLALPGATLASGPYQILGTAVSQTGDLVRTEMTIQVGTHPLDQFKFIRLAKELPPQHLKGAILFLPPLGLSFSFYEQRDRESAVGTSIAEFFALRRYDVYGYSPRFEGIPAGTCEAGVLDCSVMGNWDLQSVVDDIAFVRSQIELLHPGVPVVTGGASLGGILAIATVNAHPDDYAGIFPWEGMLTSADPVVTGMNQGYCAALQAQVAGGQVFDGIGVNVFRQVTQFARLTPQGLTPIRLFPPFLTNHQVLILTLSVPTPGPITMPVPDYVQMNGSFAEDRLFFASEPRLYENISRFNQYVPNALVRDISCALAGVDTQHVDQLGDFTGSVLMIGGGRGFGAYMDDQFAQFPTSDKTLLLEPEFGHIDHFMTERHREFVELPLLNWLRHVFP